MEGSGDGWAEDGGRPSCHTKRVVELMTCLFFHFGPLCMFYDRHENLNRMLNVKCEMDAFGLPPRNLQGSAKGWPHV